MKDKKRGGASAAIGMGFTVDLSMIPSTLPPKKRFAFLLLPNFSLLAFSAAVEPLRMANRISERKLYRWSATSISGEPESSSSGLVISPDCAITTLPPIDIVFVCGGEAVQRYVDRTLTTTLRRLAQQQIGLGGLCTGSYALAAAGLLDGYRCTIHWENLASLREQFPAIDATPNLFEIDRNRYTCSGGTAPLDMMLNLVQRTHGSTLSMAISEEFICDRIRLNDDQQRIPLRYAIGAGNPKLTEAISLMEANIEEPMNLNELSQHVRISKRQLERLFQKYLHCVPTRYYLQLRLQKARQLLLQTSKSIVEIGFACGFVSAPHFSKCYSNRYGTPPSATRRLSPTRNP